MSYENIDIIFSRVIITELLNTLYLFILITIVRTFMKVVEFVWFACGAEAPLCARDGCVWLKRNCDPLLCVHIYMIVSRKNLSSLIFVLG